METQLKKPPTTTTFHAQEEASKLYSEFIKRGVTLHQLNEFVLFFALGIEVKEPTLAQPLPALLVANNLSAEVLSKLTQQRMQSLLEKRKPAPPTQSPPVLKPKEKKKKTVNPVIAKAKKVASQKTKKKQQQLKEEEPAPPAITSDLNELEA